MKNNINNTGQNQKIPQLRFPEFEGEWSVKKLGKLGNFIGGGTPESTKKDYWKGNIPWISSSDIKEDNIQEIDITRFITEQAINESATKIIPENSVLIVSRVGIGKFAVAKQDLCTSQDFTNLITDENAFFLAYYFKARSNRFVRLSQGTSIKGFTGKDIKSAKFSIPTPPEQTKIANFLTAVDKRINLLQKKKAQLEQYKKGVMQKLFSQELRFKQDDGSDFPDWESLKIKELFSFKQGVQCGVEKQSLIQKVGQIRFIRIVDLTKPDEPIRYIDDPGKEHHINNNDLFMVRYGNAGLIGYGYQGVIANNLFRILPKNKDKIENKFYFFVFKMKQEKLEALASSSTMPALNFKALESLKLPFPHKEEQQKIANFLSSIDKSIEKVGNQIEQSQKWKKGLLQKMFV